MPRPLTWKSLYTKLSTPLLKQRLQKMLEDTVENSRDLQRGDKIRAIQALLDKRGEQ